VKWPLKINIINDIRIHILPEHGNFWLGNELIKSCYIKGYSDLLNDM